MVSIVSILFLISKWTSLFSKPLVTVRSLPTFIGITVTCIFYSFFSSQARSKYFFIFLLFFHFHYDPRMTNSYFLLTLDWVFSPEFGDPFVYQCLKEFYVYHFLQKILAWALYNWSAWSSICFLHNSQRITFPTQAGLVLHIFCASFLQSLIM